MEARKRRILQAVVDDYVATAEPVGSATIARKYRLGISPATIRSEMADLEELGYLEQPHASAGRIPSDKGYRFYVDCIVEVRPLDPVERRGIYDALLAHRQDAAALAQAAARLVAEVTERLVLMEAPAPSRSRCRLIQCLPVPPDRVLLVLVTDEGQVHSAAVDGAPEVDPELLQQASRALTERFAGQPVETVARGLEEGLPPEGYALGELVERLSEALVRRLEQEHRRQVFLGGAPHLLRQPEFRDVAKARDLLSVLEEEDQVAALLSSIPEEGVAVAIGEEWTSRPIQDCSLVASGYHAGGRPLGRLGVVGPRRTDYGRVMSVVREVSRCLSEILSG